MKKHNNHIYDCIIIGAGPGGLSLAYYLKCQSIDYLILDKGEVGDSWINMPECFELITPMWTNSLPSDFGRLNPFKKITCNEYADYLHRYAKKHQFNINNGAEVIKTEQQQDKLHIVTTNKHVYTAKSVVFATGYYSNPNYPDSIQGSTEYVIHASEFKSVADLKSNNVESALIVGKRNTAGQLLVELHNAGIKTSLSIRNELTYRYNEGVYRQFREFLYFFWEELLIKMKPDLRQDSFPPMDSKYARNIINEHNVRIYKDITKIDNNEVFFEDGSSQKFDVVVLATGYKPTFSILNKHRNIEEPEFLNKLEENNIFLIGVDNLYNFRSRYIRGMKQDARIISNKISNALEKLV